MCLGTDIYTAHIYCLEIKKRLQEKGYAVLIAPPFFWGVCQSTRGFIGSFQIRPETAKMLLYDILASLKDFGFRKVFGVNAHGDVEHAIAILQPFGKHRAAWVFLTVTPFPDDRMIHFGLNGNVAH
jgi:creatinine amidohydrolase